MMGWCIGILLLIVGFVLFMIPGSQTIGWILWMAGIVCFPIIVLISAKMIFFFEDKSSPYVLYPSLSLFKESETPQTR